MYLTQLNKMANKDALINTPGAAQVTQNSSHCTPSTHTSPSPPLPSTSTLVSFFSSSGVPQVPPSPSRHYVFTSLPQHPSQYLIFVFHQFSRSQSISRPHIHPHSITFSLITSPHIPFFSRSFIFLIPKASQNLTLTLTV